MMTNKVGYYCKKHQCLTIALFADMALARKIVGTLLALNSVVNHIFDGKAFHGIWF
jgi:hypothetical protein